MERQATSTKFEEEYLIPTQTPLQIQRVFSTNAYNLNNAMVKGIQSILENERALLLEQTLEPSDFMTAKGASDSFEGDIENLDEDKKADKQRNITIH